MITRESVRGIYPVEPLGEVVQFLDHKRRPVKQSERVEGLYPYFGANGQQGTIDDYIFDEPLVLVAEDGGHFDAPERGIAYQIEGKTWVNNHAHVLRPNSKIDIRFLTRVLENYDVRPFISGTTRAKLTKGQASRIEIPLPPLEEQRRIAAILDQADALRRLRRRALDRLNTLGQAIFHEMFGAFHDGFEGWPTQTLADVIVDAKIGAVRGSKDMSDEAPVPYLRMNSIGIDGSLRLSGLKRVEASDTELEIYSLRKGDFLFNTRNSRELVGKTAVVHQDFDGIYNNNILRCRFSKMRVNADFIDSFLRTRKGRSSLDNVKSGTTSVFAIYQKSLMTLLIPCPPMKKQQEFSKQLERLKAEEEATRISNEKAQCLFASLQHRAFRGSL